MVTGPPLLVSLKSGCIMQHGVAPG